jgi:hypothetical protein
LKRGHRFEVSGRPNASVTARGELRRVKRPHTDAAWGDQQVLTGYILHDVLEPERPADALAYLALTASDLWPGPGWNFVFGEAKGPVANAG